jgi:hypothetical protein
MCPFTMTAKGHVAGESANQKRGGLQGQTPETPFFAPAGARSFF